MAVKHSDYHATTAVHDLYDLKCYPLTLASPIKNGKKVDVSFPAKAIDAVIPFDSGISIKRALSIPLLVF